MILFYSILLFHITVTRLGKGRPVIGPNSFQIAHGQGATEHLKMHFQIPNEIDQSQ